MRILIAPDKFKGSLSAQHVEENIALGIPIEARAVWRSENAAAVIEMSEAAGLRALKDGVRDVLRANTFGVGEMLLDGAKRGAREGIVGVGGSVTNDGGFGMARALGFRFFTGEREIENGGPAEL